MTADQVFHQQDGDVTKAYYARLGALGPVGRIAVCLFRAQKRSSRAKQYSRGRYRAAAYDVKAWSMQELCKELENHGGRLGFTWGWKTDPATVFGDRPSWVLYVDIPGQGQVSFHSPDRCGCGPEYPGDWDGQHKSEERILAFCASVEESTPVAGGTNGA